MRGTEHHVLNISAQHKRKQAFGARFPAGWPSPGRLPADPLPFNSHLLHQGLVLPFRSVFSSLEWGRPKGGVVITQSSERLRELPEPRA